MRHEWHADSFWELLFWQEEHALLMSSFPSFCQDKNMKPGAVGKENLPGAGLDSLGLLWLDSREKENCSWTMSLTSEGSLGRGGIYYYERESWEEVQLSILSLQWPSLNRVSKEIGSHVNVTAINTTSCS